MKKSRKEKWLIEYDLKANGTEIHLTESFECTFGYHARYGSFRYRHLDDSSEDTPLYKVRSGNYVELLLERGMFLPLEKRVGLENAELLADEKHPITLIAPNGVTYTKTRF